MESFKLFKVRNDTGWETTWGRMIAENEYDAVEISNVNINQLVRLEQKKDGTYNVKIYSANELIDDNDFNDFKSARSFVLDYIRSTGKEERMKIIMSLKDTLCENDRSISHESELYKAGTEEYLRVLNLILDNKLLDVELRTKAFKIKQAVLKNK